MSQQLLRAVRANRDLAYEEMQDLLRRAERAGRNQLSTSEVKRFNQLKKTIEDLDARAAELEGIVQADQEAAQGVRNLGLSFGGPDSRGYTRPRGGEIYQRGSGGRSFFRDLYNAKEKNDVDARARLEQNNRLVSEAKAQERAISTSTGAGGELVPPLWLEQAWIKYVRPGRITANLCTRDILPAGTDQINIPKVNTGTAMAPVSSQNSAIQQTDLTTTSVASPVITIAGGQTVSLQLMEQSPLNIDDLILQDLAADYAKQWNTQTLSGSGSSGQVTGLLNVAGTNSITWTTMAPQLGGPGGMYSKLAGAISAINSTRFMPPDSIIMHPRRWAWACAQADNNGRPLIVPKDEGPFASMGLPNDDLTAEGFVGVMQGLRVYQDALIPTNLGAGTNQDLIIVARMSDVWMYEGTLRAEAFQQTYAQNMSVFCRAYSYGALIANRYPQAVSVIQGTGLTTPSF